MVKHIKRELERKNNTQRRTQSSVSTAHQVSPHPLRAPEVTRALPGRPPVSPWLRRRRALPRGGRAGPGRASAAPSPHGLGRAPPTAPPLPACRAARARAAIAGAGGSPALAPSEAAIAGSPFCPWTSLRSPGADAALPPLLRALFNGKSNKSPSAKMANSATTPGRMLPAKVLSGLARSAHRHRLLRIPLAKPRKGILQ